MATTLSVPAVCAEGQRPPGAGVRGRAPSHRARAGAWRIPPSLPPAGVTREGQRATDAAPVEEYSTVVVLFSKLRGAMVTTQQQRQSAWASCNAVYCEAAEKTVAGRGRGRAKLEKTSWPAPRPRTRGAFPCRHPERT